MPRPRWWYYAQIESEIIFQEYSDNVNTNQSTQEGYKLIDQIIDSTQSVALDLDNFINLNEIGSKYIKQALPADDVISKSVISEQFIIDDFVEFDFDSILISVSELGWELFWIFLENPFTTYLFVCLICLLLVFHRWLLRALKTLSNVSRNMQSMLNS